MRAHPFPKMPTVADIRSHLSKAEENAAQLEAEQKWTQVLAYAQTASPDYGGRPVRIKEQTRAAINAAGGLDWIRDCQPEDLQWAKKRFIESYRQWTALDKGQYLLPDGATKDSFRALADTKQKQLTEGKP